MIANLRDDNRLCNLQLAAQKENLGRDYSFLSEAKKNRKCVKATNLDTGERSYYYSMYAVKQFLKINPGTVKMICDGYNGYNRATSKVDGRIYTFSYISEDEIPEFCYFLKSANIKPKRKKKVVV